MTKAEILELLETLKPMITLRVRRTTTQPTIYVTVKEAYGYITEGTVTYFTPYDPDAIDAVRTKLERAALTIEYPFHEYLTFSDCRVRWAYENEWE